MPFTEKWPDLMDCCRDGCPSGRFSHLHRGTLELCQRYHRVFGHLPQFGWENSSRKSLRCSNFIHLRMIEATVFLGTFNAADIFWYPSPDLCLDTILSQSSRDNSFDLMAWSTVGPYIVWCVHFQIMSNQLNLTQVDFNQVL